MYNLDALLCLYYVSNIDKEYANLKKIDSNLVAFLKATMKLINEFGAKNFSVSKAQVKRILCLGRKFDNDKLQYFEIKYTVSYKNNDIKKARLNETTFFIETEQNFTEKDNRKKIFNSPRVEFEAENTKFSFFPGSSNTNCNQTNYYELNLEFIDIRDLSILFKTITNNTPSVVISMFQLMVHNHILELEQLRGEIRRAYTLTSQHLMLSKSKAFFEKFINMGFRITPTFPESWMYALYWGESLRKKIAGDPFHARFLKDVYFCNENEAFCGKAPGMDDHLSPCCLVCARSSLFPPIDNLKRTLSKILDMDSRKLPEFPMELPPRVSRGDSLPGEIFERLTRWPFQNRHKIEYATTVLYTINALCGENVNGVESDGGASCKDSLDQINKLWKLLDGSEPKGIDFPGQILDYLKQWRHEEKIYLKPEWLYGWFAANLFSSKAFELHRKDGTYSPDERLYFHKRFATLCLYCLYWTRMFGDTAEGSFSDVKGGYQEYLESLIHMLCEYAHIDGELPRTVRLSQTMRFMWSQQAVLYTVSEHYRDHLHHVLEVCLMGLVFMHFRQPNGSGLFFAQKAAPMKRISPKNLFNHVLTNSVGKKEDLFIDPMPPKTLRNWIVAALMHDVGYVLKLIERPLDHLAFFQEEISEEFWRTLGERFERLQKSLGKKSCELLAKMTESGPSSDQAKSVDHGVLSALVIASHLNKVNPEAWIKDMKPAIEAAAFHNFRELPIQFENHPMAFLLHLCDNLQEWDRPLIQGEQLRQSMLVNIVNSPARATHQNRPFVNYLVVNARMIKQEIHLSSPKLSLELIFGPAEDLNYYPPLTWIGHTQQMQRVKNCPLPISLVLRHPLRKRPAKSGVSKYEMDCFQTFLRTSAKSELGKRSFDHNPTDNSVLRQWAVDIHQKGNLVYYLRDDEYETVDIDIYNRDGKPLISKTPDDYIAKYVNWVNEYRGFTKIEAYGLD